MSKVAKQKLIALHLSQAGMSQARAILHRYCVAIALNTDRMRMTNASADGMNTPIQACCAKTETAGKTHPPLFTVLECRVESREAASSIFEDIVLVEGKQRGGRESERGRESESGRESERGREGGRESEREGEGERVPLMI